MDTLLGSCLKKEAIAETFINLTVSRLPSCLVHDGDGGVQPGAAVLIPGEAAGNSLRSLLLPDMLRCVSSLD